MDKSYLDASLTPEKRTEILLNQMTTSEKIGQLMQITCMKADPEFVDGKAVGWIYSRMNDQDRDEWVVQKGTGSFLHTLGNEIELIQEMALETRLGIPVLFGIDAIHGHGLHNGATVFPSQLGMACSWNTKLLEQAGRVTAKEVANDGIHWTFSPVLCLGRDLRWGRINETFGEDPYLAGELGSAIIKGYQGDSLANDDSIMACAKHYLAYGESTGGRDAYESHVTARKAIETFLPPFKKAVDAGCATFMTGYQAIDGTPLTAHDYFLNQILKEELGFDGFVVTDWNNAESLITQQKLVDNLVDASVLTIESGNDMIMNTPGFFDAMTEAIESGKMPMASLDHAVSRILLAKFKLGLFEKARKPKKSDESLYACDAHMAVNLEVTRQSIVLLENKNQTLPLSKESGKILIVGPNADDIRAQLGDWTHYTHPIPKADKPLAPHYTMRQGIESLAEKYGLETLYHEGCHISDKNQEAIAEAVTLAKTSDVIVAVVGDTIEQNGEFKDRANLDLSGAQEELLKSLKATGKPLIVILVNGKPLTIPWVKDNADAVIETFNSGLLGGLATAEILFGQTNPSGKLPISFAHHVGQLPVYYNQYSGWHGSKYIDLPMDPLYAFGYGLSYSTYDYGQLTTDKEDYQVEDTIKMSVDVTNTSDYSGEEVIQLYVNDVISSVMTPVKSLKAFKRVAFDAHEKKSITFKLPVADLFVVTASLEKVVEPGDFELMIGPDSRDTVLLKTTITVS